jgi:putative spermidine/putrescine transport system ATP-binding protein
VAAVRPEDFEVGAPGDSRVEVTVEVVEYRGQDFAVEGLTPSGRRLHFRSASPLALGERTVLGVAPERVLLFPPEEGSE